jgi:hypothetical protein
MLALLVTFTPTPKLTSNKSDVEILRPDNCPRSKEAERRGVQGSAGRSDITYVLPAWFEQLQLLAVDGYLGLLLTGRTLLRLKSNPTFPYLETWLGGCLENVKVGIESQTLLLDTVGVATGKLEHVSVSFSPLLLLDFQFWLWIFGWNGHNTPSLSDYSFR